jgi:hypothetical protein
MLGRCLTVLGRYDEAESLLLSAYQTLQSHARAYVNLPDLHRQVLDGAVALYEAWGKREQAAEWRRKRMDLDFPTYPFAR